MKLSLVLAAAFGVANAHCKTTLSLPLIPLYIDETNDTPLADNFPGLVVNGARVGSDWQYVRRTKNYQSNGPVTDVNNVDIRCYQDGTPAQTYTVSAGSNVGFTANSAPYHPGPLQFYLAKAPGSVASWDGSGAVWFKIYGEGPNISSSGLTWANNGTNEDSLYHKSQLEEEKG